ncbi:MAG: hypothetical protein DMG15_10940 [Acidobacteria bacterium]|nr:MAG: hypothetical protein DMG15_10940 [Acidobacteriota bacterium]
MLYWAGSRSHGLNNRVRHRLHAHHRQRHVQRDCRKISEYPLRPASEAVEGLAKYTKFTDAQRRVVNRENAERLVPRLKA